MKKVYGEEAVREAMRGGKEGMNFNDENWLEEVEIKVEGERATVLEAGKPVRLELVKKAGVWKIDAVSMMGMGKGDSDKDVEQATKMFEAMTNAVNEVKPKIGQSGYTAKRVNDELSQAMAIAGMKAVMPSFPRE